MENIIITMACIALILIGTVSFANSSMSSIDEISNSWKQTEKISNEIRLTEITAISSQVYDNGSRAEVVVRNDGAVSLLNFSKWDVIMRYQGGTVKWIPYSASIPGWTISGIYLNGKTEIYEPNIFNPMETMKLNIKLSPVLSDNTTNLVTIATNKGVRSVITVVK